MAELGDGHELLASGLQPVDVSLERRDLLPCRARQHDPEIRGITMLTARRTILLFINSSKHERKME
jgi:hypothetical protein